jgi:hypothetical protein
LMILLATLVLLVTGKMMLSLIMPPSNLLAPSEVSKERVTVQTVPAPSRTRLDAGT